MLNAIVAVERNVTASTDEQEAVSWSPASHTTTSLQPGCQGAGQTQPI